MVDDPRLQSASPTRQQRRADERKRKKDKRRGISDIAAGAAIALGAASLASAAGAATITVNSNTDVVGNDGQCTLREAIISANTDTASGASGGECSAGSGADVITFSGVTGTITLSDIGNLSITDSVDIQGPGRANLTVSGNNTSRVFYAYADSIFDVKISGLTISNGSANGTAGTNDAQGGGINARYVNLTLADVAISGNYAKGDGGGVYFYGRNNTRFSVTNTTITGNLAIGNGGGVYVGEASLGTVMDNVTIGDVNLADAVDDSNHAHHGGGLFFRGGGYLKVTNSSISGNHGLYGGGGVYTYDEGYDVTFDNTHIDNNDAFYGKGGGIYAYSPGGTLTVSNGSVSGNTAFGGTGGGIQFHNGDGDLVVTGSQVSDNHAFYGGGGVYAGGLYAGSSITIQNSMITGNDAGITPSKYGPPSGSGAGGGLYIESRNLAVALSAPANPSSAGRKAVGNAVPNSAVSVLIEDSTISGNKAASFGGGLYADAVGDLTIRRSTLSGNDAASGGGGASIFYSAGVIENTTVASNTMSGTGTSTNNAGGGLWIGNSDVTMAESTVSGNTAPTKGGGVFLYFYRSGIIGAAAVGDGTGTYSELIRNSIIAKNTSVAAVDPDISTYVGPSTTPTTTVTFSLIGDPGAATFTDGGGNNIGSAATPADPQLGPLSNNGGPTQTMAPLPGSPVIDTGDPDPTGLPATDQRGLLRVVNARVDMGSVEVQAVLLTGQFTFSSPTYTVTENGGFATITVQRVGGTNGVASVTYSTSNGTATAGADYTTSTGTLTWADGDATPMTFTVPIIDDNIVEASETVNLTLSNPTNGATLGTSSAVLTITDFEPGTIVVAGGPSVTVNESTGTVTITLNRTNGSNGPVTVNFSTTPGTATAGADYTAVTGTVSWADGDTTAKTITIPITIDTIVEPLETFKLNLSTTSPGAVVANPAVTITIVDAARVPTLAFWMKLMLALTCAGVGVIMLKNGRLLVVVLAAGVALTAAPTLRADSGAPGAGAAATKRHNHRNKVRPAHVGKHHATAATIHEVTTTNAGLSLKIGSDTLTVPAAHVRVFDARGGHVKASPTESLRAGLPVLYRARIAPDGSVRHMRVVIFDSLASAQAAVDRRARN